MPTPMLRRPRRLSPTSTLALLLALTACGGGDGAGPAGDDAAIALTISPSTVTLVQGATALLSASVVRSGSYTGAVTIAVDGAPSGVTGTASNLQTSGTTTTASVAIVVGATTTPGSYTLTAHASGSGVAEVTRSITLTVTAAGTSSYTLSATPATLSIAAGASGTTQIGLARTNFAGSVNLAVTNAPNGITGSFNPVNTTGNSSTLTINVAGSVAPGTYSVFYGGVATGVADKVGSVAVTVTGGGGGGNGNGSISFAACPATSKPIWFAVQDGNGAWTRVTGSGDVYTFQINQAKAGTAWVTQSSPTSYLLSVNYATKAELTTTPQVYCGGGTKMVNGGLTGATANDFVSVAIGGAGTGMPGDANSFSIVGAQSGTHDFTAWRRTGQNPAATDRGYIKRDQSTDNINFGTVDMNGANSFAGQAATLTIGNGAGTIAWGMSYYTESACLGGSLYNALATVGTTFTMYGVPAAQQRATDYHSAYVTSINGTSTRTVIELFHTMANRTITLGSVIAAPTVTSLGGGYKRLQAVYTIPVEYNTSSGLSYYQNDGLRYVALGASAGWMGSNNATLATPDFTGVDGWTATWAPTSAAAVNWVVATNGSTVNGGQALCTEGARVLAAQASGTN